MAAPFIALFARADDAIAGHLEALLRARGARTARIAFGAVASGLPVGFDGERFIAGGHDLMRARGYVLRHYPAETALLAQAPDEPLTAGAVWQRGLAQKERSHFARSAIFALDLAGARGVNPLSRTASFDLKPLQLAVFTRAGLPLPRSLVTNEPDAVRAFASEVGEAIVKPLAGGAEARLLDDELLSRLDLIRPQPAIFQARVPGVDVRVTLVDGQVLSAVEIPTEAVDYRAGAAYRAGAQEYVVHTLGEAGRSLALEAARVCGHVLSGVDLRFTPAGEYVLLEANSSPVYLDIERKTGAPISEAIVEYLLGG